MSISTGVIVTVAFEKVDYAPYAKTCTESDYECLKNVNSRVKNSIVKNLL